MSLLTNFKFMDYTSISSRWKNFRVRFGQPLRETYHCRNSEDRYAPAFSVQSLIECDKDSCNKRH